MLRHESTYVKAAVHIRTRIWESGISKTTA